MAEKTALHFFLTGPFNVEISVPPENVIRNFSKESAGYLKDHYDSYSARKADNECAVVELAAYTRILLIRFSVEKTEKSRKTVNLTAISERWKPLPTFYLVQELHIESTVVISFARIHYNVLTENV